MDHFEYRRAAQKMLQAYGGQAQSRARKRAEELREKGDEGGCDLWTRIYTAIDQLRFCGRLPGVS